MNQFRFFHPVEVRYGDLDPQGHVNNAKFFTYMEQARIQYIKNLGLWNGGSFLSIGFILAEAQISFKAPITFGQPVQGGARIIRLGNKSLDMVYRIEDTLTAQEMATGTAVLVTYDYQTGQTMPIPDNWRLVIQQFEGLA